MRSALMVSDKIGMSESMKMQISTTVGEGQS